MAAFVNIFHPEPWGNNMPFVVRSGGHYQVRPPFASADRIIRFFELFWCAGGSGIVEFGKRKCVLKRNQIAVYYPNMRHYYYCHRRAWELYWFTMRGPFALFLVTSLGLKAGIYNAGAVPVPLFQRLLRLVGQPSKQAELRACETAFMILMRMANSRTDQTDELINTAVDYIHKQYASPELNVKTLAATLGIDRMAFRTRFQAVMAMTPSAYINRLRTQKALSLLQRTKSSVTAIANQCGYADADYFSRVIHRVTGCPPLQFRKQNQ